MEQNRIERAPTLGARLQKCADFVREGKKLADIGTDHGYVPVCLLQSGKIPFAVAVDVHKGPLESAMNNASRCGVADKMHFVCGDGLHGVLPDEAEDIVIAGMGGELIARLLEKCPWVKNGVNLVLQPMTKWDVLRKWLYDNGFEVKKELACTEGQFAYSVMQAVYTGKTPSHDCDDRYLQFGFVKPEGEGKEYIARQAKRIFK